MGRLGDRIARAIQASVIGTVLTGRGGSRVVAALNTAWRRVAHLTRHSFLFQWVTKEPDPDVIVINLRKTWTVGPIIELLDRFIDRSMPYWNESALKRGLDGLVVLGERVAETRVGQWCARLFVPPEPPGESEER